MMDEFVSRNRQQKKPSIPLGKGRELTRVATLLDLSLRTNPLVS